MGGKRDIGIDLFIDNEVNQTVKTARNTTEVGRKN